MTRRRIEVTPDHLRHIANAYKQRYRPSGMAELAASEGYSERQMWRLVGLARERGFLPAKKRYTRD